MLIPLITMRRQSGCFWMYPATKGHNGTRRNSCFSISFSTFSASWLPTPFPSRATGTSVCVRYISPFLVFYILDFRNVFANVKFVLVSLFVIN